MANATGENAIQSYVLGALEKQILKRLAMHGLDNKQAIQKAVHSDYKSVYEAVDRLVDKKLVEEKRKVKSEKGLKISLFGLTMEGLDKGLRMNMFEAKKGYDILARNEIDIPLFKVEEKTGFIYPLVEPIIKDFSLPKFKQLTQAFMKEYPSDYFSGLTEFSETDPDLNIRLYVTTCLLYIKLFKNGKLKSAPEPIPKLVKEIEKPFSGLLKLLGGEKTE